MCVIRRGDPIWFLTYGVCREGKASAALGRALMGTLLLGAMKGANETVQVLLSLSGFFGVFRRT